MPITPETHAWRRRLPHLQRLDRTYFVTFCTRRRQLLQSAARTTTMQAIVDGHLRSYALYVTTIMPDHVHLIFTLYPFTTLPKAMKFIKSTSARRNGDGRIWQREYFDRIVRHEEDLRRLGEYVVANPVRAGW